MPDIPQEKVLVVGGRGFIGQALVQKLVNLKAEVVSLSRTDAAAEPKIGVRQVVADLCDRSALAKALSGHAFDYVFNAGGYIDHSPYSSGGRSVIDVHYAGTLNLLDQVYRPSLKGFIEIGSSDEYGDATAPQNERIREAPIDPYSAAKTAATHLVQTLARTENFPGVVARLFLVYGPGQDARRFLPQIIKACLKDEEFKTSEGKQIRDFCYVEDAVDAMIKAVVTPEARGQVINVASGIPISIREMIENVVELIGGGRPLWGSLPYRTGENMELYADINLAKSLLQWEPQTSLKNGLEKTVEYYRHL
jgi:nucleoside-diphosphate-sugar epimerase